MNHKIKFLIILCLSCIFIGSRKKPHDCDESRNAEIKFWFYEYEPSRCEICPGCLPFQTAYCVGTASDLLPSCVYNSLAPFNSNCHNGATTRYSQIKRNDAQPHKFVGSMALYNISAQNCIVVDLGSNQNKIGCAQGGSFKAKIPGSRCQIVLRVWEPCFRYPYYCRGINHKRNVWTYVLDIPPGRNKYGEIFDYSTSIDLSEGRDAINATGAGCD
ncbi:MAG: hypothetical protein V9E90_15080 [Saprospiraceae bacterium]